MRPRLQSSMTRLMEAGVVLLANRSKSRQKVEESSKSPKNLKGLKSCKGHRFGGTFTEAPILRQRTRTFDRTLTVFRALFAGPRSSLDTTFASIIDKAKLIELLMRCLHQGIICAAHVFLPLLQLWDAFQVLGIRTTRKLVAHALLPLFQFWKCALEKDVPAQDWWARRMLKKLCISMACSTFLKSSELS